jgi:hypothetical protein
MKAPAEPIGRLDSRSSAQVRPRVVVDPILEPPVLADNHRTNPLTGTGVTYLARR